MNRTLTESEMERLPFSPVERSVLPFLRKRRWIEFLITCCSRPRLLDRRGRSRWLTLMPALLFPKREVRSTIPLPREANVRRVHVHLAGFDLRQIGTSLIRFSRSCP